MTTMLEQVKSIIEQSNNIVFFGGAGMSTESGIPDFRSADGIYNQKYKFPPEEILSNRFFVKNPEVFYEFTREKILKPILTAKPNTGHLKLAEWERRGKLKAVITQNIDGLHQKAGSDNVLELHGSMLNNYCSRCGKNFDMDYVVKSKGVAYCDLCQGVIHPDIVLFGESLNEQTLIKTIEYITQADVLIVAGTSMVVYPAAGLINYYRGNKLILINLDPVTNKRANYFIQGKAGQILDQL